LPLEALASRLPLAAVITLDDLAAKFGVLRERRIKVRAPKIAAGGEKSRRHDGVTTGNTGAMIQA